MCAYVTERDDLLVRTEWEREPPSVYIDLPAGVSADAASFQVTNSDELYVACPDPKRERQNNAAEPYHDAVEEVEQLVASMFDIPGLGRGRRDRKLVERVPLPEEIVDAPERYQARASANNGVVSVWFEEGE